MNFGTSNTERLRIDEVGNVGIGTTTPLARVHTSGNSAVGGIFDLYTTSTASYSDLDLRKSSTNTLGGNGALADTEPIGGFRFFANNGSGYNAGGANATITAIADGIQSGTNAGGSLAFATEPNGSTGTTQERMRIAANGNVGIGTPTPGYLLDVVGTTNGNVVARIYNQSTGTNATSLLAFGTDINTNSAYIYNTGSNYSGTTGARTLVFGNGSTTGAFSFQQAGIERIRIASTGNVGINNATPGSTLQVSGSLAANIRTISTGTVADKDYTLLVTGNISLPVPSTTNSGRIYNLLNATSGGSLVITATFRDPSSSTISSFTLGTGTGGKAFIVQSDGTQWWIISRN